MLHPPSPDDMSPEVRSPVSESRGGLTPGGVGLSDPSLLGTRRRLLDLINRLQSTGVGNDIDLPEIAVIGSQSVGKSSLIESISGITLPRSSGTCTRCPTVCKLTLSKEPWRCKVSLHFETDEHGQRLGQARNVPFGDIIRDKALVEERIRRAQRAVLNPGVIARNFLDDDEAAAVPPQLAFTSNSIHLQISGPDLADLSFVDLPGLIASVSQDGDVRDIDLVKELVNQYIRKPSCLILLTVTCEVDFETQGAYQLAKAADPEKKRIIGVLTKPDRIPIDDEGNWLGFIRNERDRLDNGWFCVKLPNSKALSTGISWEQARNEEDQFFSYTPPWSTLGSLEQKQLRTRNLTARLSDLLAQLISRQLPKIQDQLQSQLRVTEDALRGLPVAPSADPVAEVVHMTSDFMRRLARETQGIPREEGLLQRIRPEHDTFKRAILATAPNFRAYNKKRSGSASTHDDRAQLIHPPEFLTNEEGRGVQADVSPAIYVEEVMERAKKAITRELPDKYPFIVTELFIKEFTKDWEKPALDLFDAIHDKVAAYVEKLAEEHFKQYNQGGLQQRVIVIVSDHVKKLAERTKERIRWLLQLEQEPFTLNSHYYQDYKDKFRAYYKRCRQISENKTLLSKLEETESEAALASSDAVPLDAHNPSDLIQALSSLSLLGFVGVKAEDLPKLLPSDPYAPAVEIMAETRAYFQVAYKRVTDIVPLAIDCELVRGLETGLEQALLKGLGIGRPEGARICRELTQEETGLSVRREELVKKLERLESAKAELLGI
ncbi:hypothetical protein NEOLEDRAFT_1171464 [Neolentinus lepideus HHB14362 ss-1]|uniref:P-loop containing nucleoside triphosphate hydrolase protein n=1 Tax=Neolentinus lepideus HHB14362 ss-1 TaxID=1314782 RepID=A0A165QEE8_9AGAM|nr:hypothetical protein NEOLEDRAFT_1171464 [Neolentinus lepideus HHB14362 ss-1]